MRKNRMAGGASLKSGLASELAHADTISAPAAESDTEADEEDDEEEDADDEAATSKSS